MLKVHSKRMIRQPREHVQCLHLQAHESRQPYADVQAHIHIWIEELENGVNKFLKFTFIWIIEMLFQCNLCSIWAMFRAKSSCLSWVHVGWNVLLKFKINRKIYFCKEIGYFGSKLNFNRWFWYSVREGELPKANVHNIK